MGKFETAGTKLVLPDLPKPDADASEEQIALAEELSRFSGKALSANTGNLDKSMTFIDESFDWLRIAYTVMLALGALALLAAVGKGLFAQTGTDVGASAVLGAVSLGLVIVALLNKPVEAMERNAVLVPWMLLTLNTYWTRLLYLKDPKTIDTQLKEAAKDAAEQFKQIAEVHAKALSSETERIKVVTGADGKEKGGEEDDDKKKKDGAGGDGKTKKDGDGQAPKGGPDGQPPVKAV